jgi:hypothetical protein
MKYIPRKKLPLFNEAFVENLWLFLSLDILLLGLPAWSIVWTLLNYNGLSKLSRPRFMAATRNGATLEFTRKEAFLAYLNNARTWMLNTSATSELRGERLEYWILSLWPKFDQLTNPIKLWKNYFGPRVLTQADYDSDAVFFKEHLERVRNRHREGGETRMELLKAEWLHEWHIERKPGSITEPLLSVPHVNLTGWFTARMQYNSWQVEIPQDFTLKWKPKSWIGKEWKRYQVTQGLKAKHLTIFTASSFGVHWLLQLERHKPKKIRRIPV